MREIFRTALIAFGTAVLVFGLMGFSAGGSASGAIANLGPRTWGPSYGITERLIASAGAAIVVAGLLLLRRSR